MERTLRGLRVLKGGLLSTIQDAGREGFFPESIPKSGAFDSAAFEVGNRLVGNPGKAAGIEVLFGGLSLEFLEELGIAVTGGDLDAKLDDERIPLWEKVIVKAGQVLTFKGRKDGLRAYVAISGGIDVPMFLGSRSTFLFIGVGGYDGRKLEAGDILSIYEPKSSDISQNYRAPLEALLPRYTGSPWTLRFVYGLQHHFFTEESLKLFSSSRWAVSSRSNRMVLRLEGPTLSFTEERKASLGQGIGGMSPSNIASEGNPRGCVQCPAGSELVLFGPDGPCVGGYTKLGAVITADFNLLGQVMPGQEIIFKPVKLPEAYAALRQLNETIAKGV